MITAQTMEGGQNVQFIDSVSKEIPLAQKQSATQLPTRSSGFTSIAQAKDGFTSVVNVTLPSERIRERAKESEAFLRPLPNAPPLEESKEETSVVKDEVI